MKSLQLFVSLLVLFVAQSLSATRSLGAQMEKVDANSVFSQLKT
jgi:hypothetical protein